MVNSVSAAKVEQWREGNVAYGLSFQRVMFGLTSALAFVGSVDIGIDVSRQTGWDVSPRVDIALFFLLNTALLHNLTTENTEIYEICEKTMKMRKMLYAVL